MDALPHTGDTTMSGNPPDALAGWRDPELARRLIDGIAQRAQVLAAQRGSAAPIKIMEVCGTHTMAIAKWGLRAVMPPNISLISGPGCPVCVTANHDIDTAIALAKLPDVTVTTFGDMMKVPGSYESLAEVKSRGGDVRIVYSPLDALELAGREPGRQVIFLAVGFETTAPLIAATVRRARAEGLENFSVFTAHKTVPRALRVLADDPEVQVAAFILPGHVSTIIGLEPYEFLAREFGIPGVIAGFEPVDILHALLMLLDQLLSGEARIEIAYGRGVRVEGNPVALAAINEVFEPTDAVWRGLGLLPGTGLGLRDEYRDMCAVARFAPEVGPVREPKGCQCGEILRGVKTPNQCRLFGRGCSPERPIGPCMVSSEGSCAAWYRYYGAII